MKVLEKIIVAIKNGKTQIPKSRNIQIEISISPTGLHLKIINLTDKYFQIKNPFLFIKPKRERKRLFTKIPKEIDLSLYEITKFAGKE